MSGQGMPIVWAPCMHIYLSYVTMAMTRPRRPMITYRAPPYMFIRLSHGHNVSHDHDGLSP